MKKIALLIFLCFTGFGQTAELSSREMQLKAIKATFPLPITGKVTDKSDAVTQRYFSKYQQRVDGLTVDTIAKELLSIRENIHNDLIQLDMMSANSSKMFDAETRAAIRRNKTWLQTKVSPWLTKLTQFQRGR